MNAAARRVGWCPGALRPMMSRDGLVVRVKPRGMALSVDQALGIAAAASRHGSGQLELTARANLQVRGVASAALPALTAGLDALGLLDADAGAEARRNVVASPLMGLDPAAAFDVRPAVAALEAALADAAGLDALPSKFGFAVSDGGAVPLGGVSADVRFDASPTGLFAVRLDGDVAAGACCAPGELPEVALRLARAFVEAAAANAGLRRMRNLVAAEGAASVLARARLTPADVGPVPARAAARPVGASDLPGVLAVVAPFGRFDAGQLAGFARGAAEAGAGELRVAPWRALLASGLASSARDRLAADAAAAGLIVDPADPRLCVAACAGASGCARGTTPVLADAAATASSLGPLLALRGGAGGGIALHLSGCAKGCAHPGPAPFTLVATEGRYALVAGGTAADAPVVTGLDAVEARRLLNALLRPDRRP